MRGKELAGSFALVSVLVACAATSATGGGASSRTYPGFLGGSFETETIALLPPARVTLPAIFSGEEGEALAKELERLVTDRLPEEVRILHPRGPVVGYREWAGQAEAGDEGGFLRSVIDWNGSPGPAGELPEVVGNSVEALGDRRGLRYFLFPRALTVIQRDVFHYAAAVEGFLLDARGERVVWAGTGYAEGSVPQDEPDQILTGVVRDAATRAVADLAANLPGAGRAGDQGGFSDVQR